MKTNKILLGFGIFLALAFALAFVSAAKTVNYNVSYAIIENDGSLNTTSTAVNGVDATVYNCTSANCTTRHLLRRRAVRRD